MPRTNYSAYLAIKRQLLEIFRTERFERNKLPSESVLAARLGISLVTLREALSMLALEGYVTKKHGSGNYLHPSALDYENRSVYFFDCLEHDGYKPEIRVLAQEVEPAGAEVAGFLRIAPAEPILKNTLLYLADGKPAILTKGHIPAALLVDGDYKSMDFHFLHVLVQQYMRRSLAHALNEYSPLGVDEALAELFDLPVGTPIVTSKQTFFDEGDTPVLFNLHAFYPNRYRVKTLQNWALSD